MHADFNGTLLWDNAQLLYDIDSDVDYAEIVDYGDSVTGGDSDVQAWRYYADDGALRDSHAGCGTGGRTYGTCARTGKPE